MNTTPTRSTSRARRYTTLALLALLLSFLPPTILPQPSAHATTTAATATSATTLHNHNQRQQQPQRPAARQPAELPQGKALHDRWYAIELSGSRSGWVRDVAVKTEDSILSRTETLLQIRRGQTTIEIYFISEATETHDNRMQTIRVVQDLAASPITTIYTFTPDSHIEVSTQSQAQPPVITRAEKPDGVWLTPAQAAEFTRKRIEAGAESFSVRTLDASSGLRAILTKSTLEERANIDVVGRTIPGLRWKTEVDIMPELQSQTWTDHTGSPARTSIDIGALAFDMILADRDIALADTDPPELLLSMFVATDKPIRNPTTRRRAVFNVTGADHLPSAAAQRAEPIINADQIDNQDKTTTAWRLTIDLDDPLPAPQEDINNNAYLAPNHMLDAIDPKIVELKQQAAARAPPNDKPARAEAMRRFVYRYIDKKDLGVGFATASETARTRTGDCTEHACLLAAMLRADGIPARTVTGLVYIENFGGIRNSFGYHMWTQALLNINNTPTWVDLDAAIDLNKPFYAAYIATAYSSMEDGARSNDLLRTAPLFGKLAITVESIR